MYTEVQLGPIYYEFIHAEYLNSMNYRLVQCYVHAKVQQACFTSIGLHNALISIFDRHLQTLLGFLMLRHHDTQDSILQTCLHRILVHPLWETETSLEFANAAFSHPVSRTVRLGHSLLIVLSCDFRTLGFLTVLLL